MFSFANRVSKKQLALMICDMGILLVTPFFSAYIYYLINLGTHIKIVSLKLEPAPFILNIFLYLTVFYVMDLYDIRKNYLSKREILNIFIAIFTASGLSIFFFYLIGMPTLGRGVFLIYISAVFLLVSGARVFYSKFAMTKYYRRRCIIIGAGKSGKKLYEMLDKKPLNGLEIICFLDKDPAKSGGYIGSIPVIHHDGSLRDIVDKYKPGLIILAMPEEKYKGMLENIIWCNYQGIDIKDLMAVYEEFEGRIPLRHVTEQWLLFCHMNHPRLYLLKIKRILDILFSGLLLLIFLPVILLTGTAIRLESRGPILFRQLRVGREGKNFTLFKFRSMIDNAEEDTGAVWVSEKDRRVTRVGSVIRLLRIDEIPQLLNVIKGEMSLIGPRPERPEFVADFIGNPDKKEFAIPFYRERLAVKPGITGWAQVKYCYAASHRESAKKLEYDLYYVKNMSLLLDAAIVLKTIKVVLFGSGAK
jgi:exopolysaccharide biosynthesis polyprenyl glycosylphosphotransferase